MRLFQWFFIASWLLVAASVSALQNSSDVAQNIIKDTTNKVLSELSKQKETLESDPQAVYKLVDEIVLHHFDFARMSKFVLGKHWRTASESQRERFIVAFRDRLVRTYSTALVKVAGENVEVEYLPVRAEDNPRLLTVKTNVAFQGEKASIDYAMYKDKAGEWKVYNVLAEGISLVTNYRTEFDNDIRTVGMDGLIKKVEESNQPETAQ